MSRLTKNTREAMARKLVAHRFTDEAKELVRLNRTLAERAYNHIYTPEVLAAVETIRKAFPDLGSEKTSIFVNAEGYHLGLGGELSTHWVEVEQIEPVKRFHFCGRYYTLTDEALIKDVKEFADRARVFNELCETAYYEALAVLETVNTGKQLAAAWPEAMPVIGDLIPEENRTLPVVQLADINAKFGLPPEAKEDGEVKAKRKVRK